MRGMGSGKVRGCPMPGPLLAVDAPSLLFRGFFALPASITGADGRPVNGLLGLANQVLQAVEQHRPRAVVLCWGPDAADYRTELYPAYHAHRPPVPDDLVHQFAEAPGFFEAFGWTSIHGGDLEADDVLGALARAEGGPVLLYTGDRDMFQCVTAEVAVLFPAKGGPDRLGPAEVRARYGIDPAQVPDFIALRGDPSDGLPGAKGIGEKGAATLLREHGSLEALIERAERYDLGLPKRAAQALRDQADELRAFRAIATLQPMELARPPDRPLQGAQAAEAARARGMGRLADRLAALGT
jgi:DNA polymerase-1